MPFVLSELAHLMNPTGCRPMFTFSPRRNSHGSCCLLVCRQRPSTTRPPSCGRRPAWSAERRCWRGRSPDSQACKHLRAGLPPSGERPKGRFAPFGPLLMSNAADAPASAPAGLYSISAEALPVENGESLSLTIREARREPGFSIVDVEAGPEAARSSSASMFLLRGEFLPKFLQ
jgi:hypothetical protein